MSETLDKAKAAFAAFPIALPVSFVETGPGEAHGLPFSVTGSFRSKDGRALIVPIPDSTTMIAGFPSVVKFMAIAPSLVKELIDRLEEAEEYEWMYKELEK